MKLHKFLKINPASGIPIYIQLMEQIRHAIESCAIAPREQLPGIRALAQEIVVSPNTVIKAYEGLEREGIIELRQGSGAFVTDIERHRDRSKHVKSAQVAVREFLAKLRSRGFSDGEIRRFVEAEFELETEEARQ